MKTLKSRVLAWALCLMLPVVANAQSAHGSKSTADDMLSYYYTQSLLNSSYTSPSKISNNLIAINDSNKALIDTLINGEKYILVATWKASDYYKPITDTKWYDIWVTIAPELKNKVKGVDSAHIDVRLKQLLGLPPFSTYKYFFTFWVRPQDLYRPCPDNEITDHSCGLCFPNGVDSVYRMWVDSQRVNRFFGCDTSNRYPWTQLGYTYDWSPKNKTHQGCSEFVIRRHTTIYMRGKYFTNQYIYGKN